MEIKISANRMNLLKLRKKLRLALRGHKLLKDKQEQLTKEFNSLIFRLLNLRHLMEEHLKELYEYIKVVLKYKNSYELTQFFEHVFAFGNFCLEEKFLNKYNIEFKNYEIKEQNFDVLSSSDFYLNYIVKKLRQLYNIIIETSNLEVLCEYIAKVLQTTRRRVNALEYILIPQIKQKINFISNKLNEFERTNISQLMRIKQLM
ncbi:MAG: V-type ATP synthase subunit D [Endomicrobiia bacterium]